MADKKNTSTKKPARKTRPRNPKSEKSGGETAIVPLKKLVDGFGSLADLANRALTEKVTYRISKAYGKVKDEVDKYNARSNKIIMDGGGTIGPMGYQLGPKANGYKKALKQLEDQKENAIKQTVKMDGILLISLDELLEALPAVVVAGDESDPDDDVIEEKPRIEAKILSDLDWLITPPADE